MSSPELIISLARLRSGAQHLRGSVMAADLGLQDEAHFRFSDRVLYDLTAAVVSGSILVRGTLSMNCEMECRRCAEFFPTTVHVSSFFRGYEIRDELESVDLTADVREDILLALPSFPLCADSCKGWCPHCGKNLNEGPCGCEEHPERSGVWDVLDAWRAGKEDNSDNKC